MPDSSRSSKSVLSGGRLFVISAPSGTGKTTISNRLRESELVRVSVSHTTRTPRDGEQDGLQYFFISRRKFKQMHGNGDFLESAEVHGNYYGTGAQWVRTQLGARINILLEIDVQGAKQIKRAKPDAVLIFIRPPSLEALEERIKKRGKDTPEIITRRLAAAESEIAQAKDYDHVIINDNLERAIDNIRAIITQEKPQCPEPPPTTA